MIRRVLGSRSGHAAGDETVLHPGEYRSIAAYIPGNLQQPFLASAAHLFALATLELAITGDIPPEEKHSNSAIWDSEFRKSRQWDALGRVPDNFNELFCDRAIKIYGQVAAVFSPVYGSLSVNVGASEENLDTVHVFCEQLPMTRTRSWLVGSLPCPAPT